MAELATDPQDIVHPRSDSTLLEARMLTKSFGAVQALREGNFALRAGEVHAIVGDNGAGKSTLVKMLAGVFAPDGGEILLEGAEVSIPSPRAARGMGVATVYQSLALVDHLDVTANLYLGEEQRRSAPFSWFGMLNKRAMRRHASAEMKRLNVGIRSVDELVAGLSGGQRQAIAVARAIAWSKRIVIMDEPTAALGVRESAQVLDLVERCREEGLGVILISHDLPEVFKVADRITVLRLGRTIARVEKRETTPDQLVGMITGATEIPANGTPAPESASPAGRDGESAGGAS